MLELAHINYSAGGRDILHDISCRFQAGKITALIGPNGAGKTSLLRIAAGLVTPQNGAVTLADASFEDPQARARNIAYLPQFQSVAWPLLCRDVVALGLAAQVMRRNLATGQLMIYPAARRRVCIWRGSWWPMRRFYYWMSRCNLWMRRARKA
jgi:ABC-type cobalamin/Fe3+-siderophores transport system ATPase subunit